LVFVVAAIVFGCFAYREFELAFGAIG
jgi:hypothetical protein